MRRNPLINIVYMATPEIAVKSLDELNKCEDINILAVVTQIDRPKGRGNKLTPPPVKVFALNNNIPVFQTEKISKDEGLINKLKELKPDFFVTFAFGQILSEEVLKIPKYSTVNLHASLLPKYRGANPIQRCLYNGDKKTGITTMLTVLELDAGDICEVEEIDINENMTDLELTKEISEKSPKIICSTLRGLYLNKIKPIKQNPNEATTAKKFNKNDAMIDWTKTAKEIHNQIRSMLTFPTACTILNGKTVKIMETRLTDSKFSSPAKIVKVSKDGIEIGTKEGCILITKVKPESKGIMSAYDYANGAKIKPDMEVGE